MAGDGKHGTGKTGLDLLPTQYSVTHQADVRFTNMLAYGFSCCPLAAVAKKKNSHL